MYTYNYSYGYSLGYSGGYNPYINYTWEMLPNAKVKNSGTSGVDLQLYSGNPLDFQGSQYIPNITLAQPLDTMNDFTITLRASQNVNNRVFFDDATGALKCTLYGYYDDSFPVRFIFNGIAILNFVGSAEFIGKQTTYSIKRVGNTIYGYVDGQLNCTGDLTGISSPTINEMFLGTDGAFNSIMDGQYDMFVVSNTGLADEQIQQSYTNPNEFYNSCAKAGGELYANTLFCTDFGGTGGYVADDRNVSVGENLLGNESSITLNHWVKTPDKYEFYSNGTAGYLLLNNIRSTNPSVITVKITNYVSGGAIDIDAGKTLNSNGVFTYISYVSNVAYRLYSNLFVGTVEIIDVSEISNIYPITNYSATQRTNFTQESKGLQDLTRLFDSNGFFLDNTNYLNCNGKGKATVIEPSRTSKVTIQTNPTILSGNILSGGVTLTTAGLTVGIDNDIVLDNQAISSNIDIGVGYKGKVTIYKEDLL